MRTGLFAIVALFSLLGAPFAAAQGVGVDINIGAPPPLNFAAPPDVVVVPSGDSYVYMVPNRVGVYFYGGSWYRYHGGHWFHAQIYNGPWTYTGVGLVPAVVVGIPPEYPRFLPPGYHRVHYRDLHSHWREWDRGRQWHAHEWYRREMRPEIRRERFTQIERQRGTRGAAPGTRSTPGAGAGAHATRPSAGAGSHTTGPGAGAGSRGAPGAAPGMRSTPGAGAGPHATRPSAGAGSHTTGPGAGAGSRGAPGAAPGMRSTPGAGAGSHATGPSAGAGPRGSARAGVESHNNKKDK